MKEQEAIRLWSVEGAFIPRPVEPQFRDTEALQIFQSFLCNGKAEREDLSNVIMLWEMIPKFTAAHLNTRTGVKADHFNAEFMVGDNTFSMSLFPGNCYTKIDKSDSRRRYPGIREQVVEQAIIHLAGSQADTLIENGDAHYRVTFTIRDVARQLKENGSTMSHGHIREALEVLSSSIMTISAVAGEDIKHEKRYPIIPSFERLTSDHTREGGRDCWSIRLHPMVAHAIRNVTYRQFPRAQELELPPWARHLLRQLYFRVPNISSDYPFEFMLTELQANTPGITLATTVESINAVTRELEWMKERGTIDDFKVEWIYPEKRRRGRPSPIDALFTVYPSHELVKHVKAGSKRMEIGEKTLGLSRAKRQERQMMLPLS